VICPKCGKEMEILDVLTCRTTDPKDDDIFEKMWVCSVCDIYEPYILEKEDEI